MHELHNDPHFLRLFLHGEVGLQGLYDAQKELMLHPAYPHKNSLWVFDEEFKCEFSHTGMFGIIDRTKIFFPIGATKEKGALLSSGRLHYAFFKLFCEEAELESFPFKVMPFMSYDEAERWLKEGNRM
jgi:hypothetical protein